jgi:hypothetical protein
LSRPPCMWRHPDVCRGRLRVVQVPGAGKDHISRTFLDRVHGRITNKIAGSGARCNRWSGRLRILPKVPIMSVQRFILPASSCIGKDVVTPPPLRTQGVPSFLSLYDLSSLKSPCGIGLRVLYCFIFPGLHLPTAPHQYLMHTPPAVRVACDNARDIRTRRSVSISHKGTPLSTSPTHYHLEAV